MSVQSSSFDLDFWMPLGEPLNLGFETLSGPPRSDLDFDGSINVNATKEHKVTSGNPLLSGQHLVRVRKPYAVSSTGFFITELIEFAGFGTPVILWRVVSTDRLQDV